MTDAGAGIAGADVRAEGIFGPAAGSFAGQRVLTTKTNAKGEWSLLGISPGVWLFEVRADGFLPETVVLPNRLLTASSPNAAGQMFTWELVLKPQPATTVRESAQIVAAADAVRAGHAADAESALLSIPDGATTDYLAAAGRVAIVAGKPDAAKALFVRALEIDPSSYRAALGVASAFLLLRDFDSASRAFDAARARTHDKDEQRFISAALGDLATIRVR